MRSYRVSVAKDYLSFSSAHFITFRGHKCESLHGHNYRVAVVVEGDVDAECLFVLDFAVLKQVIKPMVDAVDHKVLLPTQNEKIGLREEGDAIVVDYFGKGRFVFPRSDVALVPVKNTTAEMLAEYFAAQVRDALLAQGHTHLTRLDIEVEESPGQAGGFSVRFDGKE